MANHPEEIAAWIDWDFNQEAPSDFSEFIAFAKNFQEAAAAEIPLFSIHRLMSWVTRTNLSKSTGFKTLRIRYEYVVELDNGDWEDRQDHITMEEPSGITFGMILYQLHHRTDGRLKNQDIMAIEGFEIVEGTENDSVPTYVVFFGS